MVAYTHWNGAEMQLPAIARDIGLAAVMPTHLPAGILVSPNMLLHAWLVGGCLMMPQQTL